MHLISHAVHHGDSRWTAVSGTEGLAQAVRAMRFDAGANRKKLDTAESARERVIAEEELAKALEEDDGL